MSLKDDMKDDLDVFFNTDEFAQSIKYNNNTISALVRKGEIPAVAKGGVAYKAKIEIKKTDVPNPKIHDVFIIDEESWLVEGIEASDGYIWRLRLRKDEAAKYGK